VDFPYSLVGTFWSFSENLIPLLGLVVCMMAELSVWNWIYFTIWLIGLTIYFGFSRKNSKLNFKEA
jgi:uncharacterized protein involved in cysteine biosynthesis